MATGTWGNIALDDPSTRAFVLQMVDASNDSWAERLIVALTATLAAVEAWIVLYQTVTQASVWAVTEENSWIGARSPGNATFLARSGIENGINMTFKNATTLDTEPLRVVAPVAAVMQGTLDIPDVDSAGITNLITATDALMGGGGFSFETAQYTSRRERKNNPRVS